MNTHQFSQRIGNIEERLVQQSDQTPNYARQRRSRGLRRLLPLAAVLALMACSFTVGALTSGAEKQETIALDGIGLTLLLPEEWKDLYGVEMDDASASCGVYVKSIHESTGDWAGAGYLFWISKAYDVPMTPEEVEAVSPVACRYLFSTTEGTYILAYASDVQWDPSEPAQEEVYRSMSSQISQIRFLMDHIF